MLVAAAAVALVLLLLVLVVPERLARADWPARAPTWGLLLWQALGLSAVLLPVQLALTVALAPVGETHVAAVQAVLDGDAPAVWWSLLAALLAALLVGRLLQVLAVSTARTLRARRSHRALVDLVATRNPLLARTRVVDHHLPLAYCLPGLLRPRVVLSRGVLDLLREDEVRAVIAHEDAHVEQRHDLVVLPFVALVMTLPRLRRLRTAREHVALLVEMLADDQASRSHPPQALARALCKIGASPAPSAGLGATGHGALVRAQRLLSPPPRLGPAGVAAASAATALVLGLPALGLLVPLAV